MNPFIHIRSSKFHILPGEEDEIVNEGMYGKAVAEYLQQKLRDFGYDVPFYCCEDWGWWVEVKDAPFPFGVCIYCDQGPDGRLNFFCSDGAARRTKWSWKRFKFVDATPWANQLRDDLLAIVRADPEIQLVNASCEEPFVDEEPVEPPS